MDIAPINRSAVSDAVFGQLVDEILSGRLQPGDALPSERELAESFGVNRHAIREALKRIQQSGLVRISQGGKTRVLDWRTHAGLEALSSLATSGAVPALRLIHDIMVMRRSIGADAARLCAENATDTQIKDIQKAATDYPAEAADLESLFAVDVAFWAAVVEGADNVAYQLSLNTLTAGMAGIGLANIAGLEAAGETADRQAHLDLADLIAARDAAGARNLAEELLGRVVSILATDLKE